MPNSIILKLLPFGISIVCVGSGYFYINREKFMSSTVTNNNEGKSQRIAGRSGSEKSTNGNLPKYEDG